MVDKPLPISNHIYRRMTIESYFFNLKSNLFYILHSIKIPYNLLYILIGIYRSFHFNFNITKTFRHKNISPIKWVIFSTIILNKKIIYSFRFLYYR